ncbi:MAG: TolC family protein [Verrucomicrobia bacterium]|nr:TolC family protein [Verrucomicrobiota bacterium]MCH8514344.1 TolC family protein [Kiritimatiellia bacterium]
MTTPSPHAKFIRLAILSLGLMLGADESPALGLQEAIDLALRHNRTLLNARADVDDAGLTLTAREADFNIRPGVRLQAGQRQEAEQIEGGLELRRRFSPGGEVQIFGGAARFDGETETRLRANARQPLFRRAGRLVTLEPKVRAERALTDARRAYYERKQDLVLEVATAHEAVLRAARQVEADERTLERLTGLVALTRVREDTGQVTRVDTLRIEQQLGEADARRDNSRDILEQHREEFVVLLGLDPLRAFDLLPPPLLEIDTPHPDEGYAMALANRLDFARALDVLDDSGRAVRIARRNLQPDVQLLGDLEYRGNEFDGAEPDNWFIGIAIEPDFNPADRRANLGQTENRQAAAERQLVDLHYAVQLDVRRQIRNYHRSRTNHRIAIRNRELADKRLELAEALFRMGRGDAFSLSDAEDAHAQAISAELTARSEASLAAFRLLRALGTLIEVPDELKATP